MIKFFRDLWKKIFKTKPEDAEERQETYDQIVTLNTMAVALQRGAEKIFPAFIRETVYLSKAVGLMDESAAPLSYVWWSLMEAKKYWPTMSRPEKTALLLMTSLLGQSGKVPNYRASPTRPGDMGYEQKVERVLQGLAKWSLEKNGESNKQFNSLAAKSAKSVLKATPELGTLKYAEYFIQFALRKRLDKESWMFPTGVNGPWLYSWVELFYRK